MIPDDLLFLLTPMFLYIFPLSALFLLGSNSVCHFLDISTIRIFKLTLFNQIHVLIFPVEDRNKNDCFFKCSILIKHITERYI